MFYISNFLSDVEHWRIMSKVHTHILAFCSDSKRSCFLIFHKSSPMIYSSNDVDYFWSFFRSYLKFSEVLQSGPWNWKFSAKQSDISMFELNQNPNHQWQWDVVFTQNGKVSTSQRYYIHTQSHCTVGPHWNYDAKHKNLYVREFPKGKMLTKSQTISFSFPASSQHEVSELQQLWWYFAFHAS